MAAKTTKSKVEAEEKIDPRVVGKTISRDLSTVKPNTWNPNRMTPFLRESLKHGLKTDGWLASQALLIWGSDERGRTKSIIIDGEHRWTVAGELGFKKCPMVVLEKMTEAQAKALTVKMNQKRGEFDPALLSTLLREIQYDYPEDLSLQMGFEQNELMPLLAEPEVIVAGDDLVEIDRGPSGAGSGMPSSQVRMVQLFLNPDTHAEFNELIRKLATKYGTKNVSDTTLEAIRHAAGTATKPG